MFHILRDLSARKVWDHVFFENPLPKLENFSTWLWHDNWVQNWFQNRVVVFQKDFLMIFNWYLRHVWSFQELIPHWRTHPLLKNSSHEMYRSHLGEDEILKVEKWPLSHYNSFLDIWLWTEKYDQGLLSNTSNVTETCLRVLGTRRKAMACVWKHSELSLRTAFHTLILKPKMDFRKSSMSGCGLKNMTKDNFLMPLMLPKHV